MLETVMVTKAQTAKTNPAPAMSSANAGEQAAARAYWEALLSKCGDSYTAWGVDQEINFFPEAGRQITPNRLIEYKGVSFGVYDEALSTADKLNLNGLQQKAVAIMRPSASRDRERLSQTSRWDPWSKWEDAHLESQERYVRSSAATNGAMVYYRSALAVRMVKQNGAWRYGPDSLPLQKFTFNKPTCQMITPSELEDAEKLAKQQQADAQAELDRASHQEALQGEVYRAGKGITHPSVLRSDSPIYPETARKAKVEGIVTVAIVVDAEGNPRDITVANRLGMGLDEAAIECVKKWKFRPGLKDGKPVNTRASVQVNFKLL